MKTSLLLSLALSTFTLSANASIVPDGYDPFKDHKILSSISLIELDEYGPQECERVGTEPKTDQEIQLAKDIVNIRMKKLYNSYVDQNLQYEDFEEELLDSMLPPALNISDPENCRFLKEQQLHHINLLKYGSPYHYNYQENETLKIYAYSLMKAIKLERLYYSTSIYNGSSKSQDILDRFGFYFSNSNETTLDLDNVLISRITNSANHRISKANENKDLVNVDIPGLQDAVDNLHYLTIQLIPLTGYERNKYGTYNYELYNILDQLLNDVEKTAYLINFYALDDNLREDGLILNLNMLNLGLRSDYKIQFLNDFYSFKNNTAAHMSQKNLQRSINNHAQYLIETYGNNSKYTNLLISYINREYEDRPQ